ncbi:hypothetical protein KAF44_26655 (plasmid) [Cupriavidus necator]|nr:hypothetical protein KAF44_26655 [Cupriavidus necator]
MPGPAPHIGTQLCQSMEAWAVANALNALSKWPDQAKARDAALRLAERVSSEPSCASRWRRNMCPMP